MKTVIFDLDGTLADIEHRRHLVNNGNNRWDEFYRRCVDDKPNNPVIENAQSLYQTGYRILIFSGRSDIVKAETKIWLDHHQVPYHQLFMRKQGDNSPDDQLKLAMLHTHCQKNQVLCVFDDRQKVVDMWRREGLACFQVAPGDF